MKRHKTPAALTQQLSDPESPISSLDEDTDSGENAEYVPMLDPASHSSSASSTPTEDEMETEEHHLGWKSKSGLSWSSTNDDMLKYKAPSGQPIPGPTRYATARISSLQDSMDLMITEDIIGLIVEMTNIKGRRSVEGWHDTDATEIRAFIGLMILSGVYRSRGETTLSLWQCTTGRVLFSATMSRKRFVLLASTIRFNDRLTKLTRQAWQPDKLAPFRKLWDLWVERLPLLFNPGPDICVDEQLVPFHGRCSFRQYMPKKPAKYGIKIWTCCDVRTTFACRMEVYTGKAAGGVPEVQQGQRVVLGLTAGLQGTVTTDNFFTSYGLAEELLSRKLALVGTIRKNKPDLPPILLSMKDRRVFSSLFAFHRTVTAVSYVSKRGKSVILLSTRHREPATTKGERQKPQIILDYNRCKGAVDTLDKLVATYSCRRKTSRWPMALFQNVIDVSTVNGFILWTAVDPNWNKHKTCRRRLYLEELGKLLVFPQMARRKRLPRDPQAVALVAAAQAESHDPAPLPTRSDTKRRACHFCKHSLTRKPRISTTCHKCRKPCCKDHTILTCSHCCKSSCCK